MRKVQKFLQKWIVISLWGGDSILSEVVTDYWHDYGTFEIQTNVLSNPKPSQM
jgi:hypothetical protein